MKLIKTEFFSKIESLKHLKVGDLYEKSYKNEKKPRFFGIVLNKTENSITIFFLKHLYKSYEGKICRLYNNVGIGVHNDFCYKIWSARNK